MVEFVRAYSDGPGEVIVDFYLPEEKGVRDFVKLVEGHLTATVRQLRAAQGLRQEDVGGGLYLSQQVVSNHEKGKIRWRLGMACLFAEEVGIPLSLMLFGSPYFDDYTSSAQHLRRRVDRFLDSFQLREAAENLDDFERHNEICRQQISYMRAEVEAMKRMEWAAVGIGGRWGSDDDSPVDPVDG